jgi:hypothetical protein
MPGTKYPKTVKWLWALAYLTVGLVTLLGFLIRHFLLTGRWFF